MLDLRCELVLPIDDFFSTSETIFKLLALSADVNRVTFCSLELSLFRLFQPSNRTDTATATATVTANVAPVPGEPEF